MSINIEEYKTKKLIKTLQGVSSDTSRVGLLMGEAFHALAYKVREMASREEVNKRNLDKLNKNN